MLVFVYGTLTDRERAAQLLDDFEFVGSATLDGLHRVDGEYPTLAPGGSVDGRLLETDAIDRLDTYEGVERGLYTRVSMPIEGAETPTAAAVYVGDPEALGAAADWPGPEPFPDCVETYLDSHSITIRIN